MANHPRSGNPGGQPFLAATGAWMIARTGPSRCLREGRRWPDGRRHAGPVAPL